MTFALSHIQEKINMNETYHAWICDNVAKNTYSTFLSLYYLFGLMVIIVHKFMTYLVVVLQFRR